MTLKIIATGIPLRVLNWILSIGVIMMLAAATIDGLFINPTEPQKWAIIVVPILLVAGAAISAAARLLTRTRYRN